MRPRYRVQRSVSLIAASLLGVGSASAQTANQVPAPLPVTRIDDRSTRADLDAPGAVSLAISSPLPIRDALLQLVAGTPFSLVVGDDVDGAFAGELKELSIRQGLEAMLFPRALDYTIDRTVIRVHRQRPLMRLFDVSYLNVQRGWERRIRSDSPPGGGTAAGASTTVAGSFFQDLESGVQAILSANGRVHVDERNGVVQVTDIPERLDRVAVYLETVHQRAVRQVRLEARVFEVTLTDPQALALDWKAVADRSGEAWQPLAGAPVGVRVADFANVMTALSEQGTVRMLASQQIVAMNNEPAVMRAGTQGVYFTTTAAAMPGGGSERTTAPVSVHEGLTLTLVPQIAADGVVQVSLSPTLTAQTGEARSRQGERVPVLAIAEADTLVRMRDGETVMMSGFTQEKTITRQVEGMAGFFGSQVKEKSRTELVILLKATIVAPGAPVMAGTR